MTVTVKQMIAILEMSAKKNPVRPLENRRVLPIWLVCLLQFKPVDVHSSHRWEN